MARKKALNAGDELQKVRWNKAKTKKWDIKYTLVEVKEAKRRKGKKAASASEGAGKAKKTTTRAKASKPAAKRTKAASKRTKAAAKKSKPASKRKAR